MELMQKYLKKENVSRVNNLVCWFFDFLAMCFLSDTIFATLLDDLIKVSMTVDFLNYM